MTILIVATAIAALVAIAKVNPFLAFLAVSIGMAIAFGEPPADVPPLVQKGLGSILGGLTIVIAAGAMLGRLVVDSGVDKQIAAAFEGLALDPLLLAWLLTVGIRVCVASATVAGLTAASILAPLVADPPQGVDPNLMVLAVGSGSLACSHVNDAGFWLFKEYFSASIPDTFRCWTAMETIVDRPRLAAACSK
ncbi:MAG: hypothetical protein WCH77_08510 [Planctomycetota bacterium]